MRGSGPFLRVCLGSSVISESTPSREHAPPTKVPTGQDLRPGGAAARRNPAALYVMLYAIHIDLAPVVLGRGIRLFDHLTKPIDLLVTEASGNPHVTHLTYRVIK